MRVIFCVTEKANIFLCSGDSVWRTDISTYCINVAIRVSICITWALEFRVSTFDAKEVQRYEERVDDVRKCDVHELCIHGTEIQWVERRQCMMYEDMLVEGRQCMTYEDVLCIISSTTAQMCRDFRGGFLSAFLCAELQQLRAQWGGRCGRRTLSRWVPGVLCDRVKRQSVRARRKENYRGEGGKRERKKKTASDLNGTKV